jgi:hypothetical protein
MTSAPLPTREEERELHRRLLDGDRTVSVDLIGAYVLPLSAWLREQNHQALQDDLLFDVVYLLLESLCVRPAQYKPEHSLWSFLKMSARDDLRNLLAKLGRRAGRRVDLKLVEESADGGNSLEDDPAFRLVDEEERESIRKQDEDVRRRLLPRIVNGLSDAQRTCLDLLIDGERSTAPYAAALGVTHLAAGEQEREVKRVKDMLKKRIERARRNDDEPA